MNAVALPLPFLHEYFHCSRSAQERIAQWVGLMVQPSPSEAPTPTRLERCPLSLLSSQGYGGVVQVILSGKGIKRHAIDEVEVLHGKSVDQKTHLLFLFPVMLFEREGKFKKVHLACYFCYQGRDLKTRDLVVVQTLLPTKKMAVREEARVSRFVTEHCREAVPAFFGEFFHNENPVLVYKAYTGDFFESIRKGPSVEKGTGPYIAYLRHVGAVLEPLASLHAAGVVHCDVKPENFVGGVGEEPLQLTDFGFSQLPERVVHHGARGSLMYAAPELLELFWCREFFSTQACQRADDALDGESRLWEQGMEARFSLFQQAIAPLPRRVRDGCFQEMSQWHRGTSAQAQEDFDAFSLQWNQMAQETLGRSRVNVALDQWSVGIFLANVLSWIEMRKLCLREPQRQDQVLQVREIPQIVQSKRRSVEEYFRTRQGLDPFHEIVYGLLQDAPECRLPVREADRRWQAALEASEFSSCDLTSEGTPPREGDPCCVIS